MALTRGLIFVRLVNAIPVGAQLEFVRSFFEKAKETVRAKGARVNSVFLVQLRKTVAADFRRGTLIKKILKVVPFRGLAAVV